MPVDVPAAAAYLAQRYEDASTPVPIERGEWSDAFTFEAEGQQRVIRFGQHRDDYEKDRMASGFATPALPVPPVLEVGEALDGVYAISERAFGSFLEQLDGAAFRATLPSLFAALDALREVPPLGEGYGWWLPPRGNARHRSWREFLLEVTYDPPGNRIGGWRELLASRPGAEAAFEEGYAVLEQLSAAVPEVRNVIHTDLFAGNVLVEDGQITAVVDWANACYGDSLFDLAHIAFWLPWFPELADIDLVGAAAEHYAAIGLDVPQFEERLRCCLLFIGLDAQRYNAFTHRWDELERSTERMLKFARGG